ncbi:MAG: UDP-N-acetylglucosamine 2-epimerase (non-hydrolyzing) [Anaerolineae bacterium]|nr:UDP-N-acetylglucosamine 2-epimerase (non-hydrolyzing) [Anaerolineae bacterium]
MKILSVVGARPQFIKAVSVCAALRASFTEILVHTGQHYNDEMSAVFFRELNIPEPDYNLNVGSSSHGQQTGAMLAELEKVIVAEQPDCVLVYGDTNSTLAGALAAAKLNVPIAHIEAGLRSFNRAMPEEVNRILTDHCSTFLFCPTRKAVDNLGKEGIVQGVALVGDVMMDTLRMFLPQISDTQGLDEFGVEPGTYNLATIHRASNTESAAQLQAVIDCLAVSELPVIFPAHPRTSGALQRYGITLPGHVTLVPPVGYLKMLTLERHAQTILTDSGGVQKEAYMLAVPCVTLRHDTEWVETTADGWNTLVGLDKAKTRAALRQPRPAAAPAPAFGDGTAALKIAACLADTKGNLA